MSTMRTAQLIVGASLAALGAASVVVGLLAGGGSAVLPVVIVVALGVLSAGVVAWLRQRPVAPDNDSMYVQTVLMKLAAAEAPAVVAIALAVAVGPGWVGLLGFLVTIAVSLWLWPSDSDLERHHLVYLT